VKIRARGRTYATAAVAADAKVEGIAGQVKNFLKRPCRGSSPQVGNRGTIPFDRVIAPAVTFAVGRLRSKRLAVGEIMAHSAWRDLGKHLLARLSFALAPTLRLQHSIEKAVERSERRRHESGEINFLETVKEFPGALDTAARIIAAWWEAQDELLDRLWRDKDNLCDVFLNGRRHFRIVRIRAGLSDPHNGGKTATMLEFAGRGRVIYKPRSGAGEELWFTALGWLARNGLQFSFRVPKILKRKNYLWMEFLPTRGCRTAREIRNFYFRWGAQAALAQILGATDLHRENWLAVGSQPILVDAELIGDAEPPKRTGRTRLDRQSLPMLLQTGLLPLTPRDRVGFYQGIAPFDATIPETAPPSCWPRYRRAIQKPSKYVNDLVRGFEAVAGIFADRCSAEKFFREIVSPAGQRKDGRVLLRASAQYARLLRDSVEARNMVSAGERWRLLARECCASAENRRVGLAEVRSLLRCDIPKFTTRRRAVPASWKSFSAAIADLKGSSRLLRRRVLLGIRPV